MSVRTGTNPKSSWVQWWSGGRGWSGVAQWPNPAIVVWLLAVIVAWTDLPRTTQQNSVVIGIGRGALLVWALDELVRGVSPLRRLLGLVVLAVQLSLIRVKNGMEPVLDPAGRRQARQRCLAVAESSPCEQVLAQLGAGIRRG